LKTQKNSSIGTKTYTYVKFIATIGSILLLIVPFFSLLYFWKNFLNGNLDQLNLITFLLWTLSLVILGIYLFIRVNLFRKSAYQHTKKEQKMLFSSFTSYGIALLSAFIYLTLANLTTLTDEIKIYLAILFISLVLIANSVGAILESFSRIGEQKYLYDENIKKQKENNVTFSNSGVERTPEAQEILNAKKRIEIDDSDKVLENFFDKNN